MMRNTRRCTVEVRRSPSACLLALMLVIGSGWVPAGRAQSLTNPRRLADGPPGQLLVADRGGSVVAVDKDTLQPVWDFPLPGEGAPFGLAMLNRLVFVGNTETHDVEVYRLQGSSVRGMQPPMLFSLGATSPGGAGSIARPISIAVDRSERLVFVLDGVGKRVKVFDPRGVFIQEFAPADAAGEVLSPVSVAVDPNRKEVLIGDYGDPSGYFSVRKPARILIYDYQGNFRFQILGDGSTDAGTRFSRVQGIAVSRDGRIFFADPLANHIFVVDRKSGKLLATLGQQGTSVGDLRLPLDVLLDERTGDLFISNNMGARKVEVFRGVGRTR